MLEGKVAVITGASRGIGAAIAAMLGAQGGTVVGTATSHSGAETITQRLQEAGHAGTGMVLDVTDSAAVAGFVERVEERYGSVAVLVNNAGITRDALLLRMKEEDWDAILDTDLTSVFRLTRGFLRGMMKARHGRVINIASVVGVTGNAGQANYAAAKAGMMGFTKALAREVGSRNITVNCVAPGFIETDMTRGLSAEQQAALLHGIPLGRLGSAADVAAAVAFLVSSGADYITGSTLHVNGGMYMN
jgi:3-oxoacyl-[acyl-carrier protein] reductase